MAKTLVTELTLDKFKSYARIDGDADNDLIKDVIIPAAISQVESITARCFSDAANLEFSNFENDLLLAAMQIAINFYDNRSATSPVELKKIPFAAQAILASYRKISI